MSATATKARYRLNVGRHVQDHPTERIREGGLEWPAEQVFVQGQIIESVEDLERLNSPGAGGPKFTKLDDPQPEDTIETLEAKLAALRAKQSQDSFSKANEGKTEVQKAAEQGFHGQNPAPNQAVIPDAPKAGPSNKIPNDVSKESSRTLAQLNALSHKQLIDLAAEEEVTIPSQASREQIIKVLRGGK